jgi:hypothetical protein
MPRRPWRRRRDPDPLGDGLWRRLYDDCATAARRAPVLADMLPRVRALAEEGQARWPADGLDVPSTDAGRAHYLRLRDVRRAFADVAYRMRLAEVPGEVPSQDRHLRDALHRARTLAPLD